MAQETKRIMIAGVGGQGILLVSLLSPDIINHSVIGATCLIPTLASVLRPLSSGF
jgi:hypothetical protein